MSSRVVWLFTTFPKSSEVFLQREVRALGGILGAPAVELHSLWGGKDSFDGQPVHCLRPSDGFRAFAGLLYWLVRRPRALLDVAAGFANGRCGSLTNLGETLLGLTWALARARSLVRDRPGLIHAAWATAPGTAAWLAARLADLPFTLDAHAYDIFRDGGDWALEAKLAAACEIRTSTAQARDELLRRGAPPTRTHLIRRSLTEIPAEPKPARLGPRLPLRLVSVGRFIEKKGWLEQLELYAHALAAGLPLYARLIGWGPLLHPAQAYAAHLGIERHLTFEGQLPPEGVAEALDWADVFVFTGKIAQSGDRDGLPNVLAEAMAAGLPIVTTPVAGTTEAVRDGETGLVRPLGEPDAWHSALHALAHNDRLYEDLRLRAHRWVSREFAAPLNARRIRDLWQAATTDKPPAA